MLDVRVLGQLQVAVKGNLVEVAAPMQRALLGSLALARGHVMTRDQLVDALWADPPATARERRPAVRFRTAGRARPRGDRDSGRQLPACGGAGLSRCRPVPRPGRRSAAAPGLGGRGGRVSPVGGRYRAVARRGVGRHARLSFRGAGPGRCGRCPAGRGASASLRRDRLRACCRGGRARRCVGCRAPVRRDGHRAATEGLGWGRPNRGCARGL